LTPLRRGNQQEKRTQSEKRHGAWRPGGGEATHPAAALRAKPFSAHLSRRNCVDVFWAGLEVTERAKDLRVNRDQTFALTGIVVKT